MVQPDAPRTEEAKKGRKNVPDNWFVMGILVCVLAVVLATFIIFLLTPGEVYMPGKYVEPAPGAILAGEQQVNDSEFDWTTTNQVMLANTGPGTDVIAVFTDEGSKRPLVAYFVPAGYGEAARLRNGTYDLYLFTGRTLNPATKKFEQDPAYYRWNRTISFVEHVSEEIELDHGAGLPVNGTVAVPESDMPVI